MRNPNRKNLLNNSIDIEYNSIDNIMGNKRFKP